MDLTRALLELSPEVVTSSFVGDNNQGRTRYKPTSVLVGPDIGDCSRGGFKFDGKRV